MKDTVNQNKELALARVWEEREKLLKELRRHEPDTMEASERASDIIRRIDELEAEYKELGGILYDSPIAQTPFQ